MPAWCVHKLFCDMYIFLVCSASWTNVLIPVVFIYVYMYHVKRCNFMYIFFYTLRSFDTINIFDRIFYHPDLIVQRHYVPHLELSCCWSVFNLLPSSKRSSPVCYVSSQLYSRILFSVFSISLFSDSKHFLYFPPVRPSQSSFCTDW